MRMAQIQEIIKLNASIPFTQVIDLIDEVFGESNIYQHSKWRIIYDKYQNDKGLISVYFASKTQPYYTNESCYGTVYYHYNTIDEVNDFTENCKLSFSERLKITQLYLK